MNVAERQKRSKRSHIAPQDDPVTAGLLRDQQQRRELHDGSRLVAAAAALSVRLPDEPVLLLSRNPEGTAIAAACAVLRAQHATSWDEIVLYRSYEPPQDRRVVFVDALNLAGTGIERQ